MQKALGLRRATQGGGGGGDDGLGWGPEAWEVGRSLLSVLCSCPASRQKALSLISCFAGGVFLATCLLDLLPDYLAAIDEALAALHVTVSPCWMRVTLRGWVCSIIYLWDRWLDGSLPGAPHDHEEGT